MKRVFLTGATGFIGQAIVKELLAHHYEVIGLTRSQTGANLLKAMGATPHIGTLENRDLLLSGIEEADAVIHTAFNHDFSTFKQNCEDDRKTILAIGQVLKGSSRPLLVTSGAHKLRALTAEQIPRAASDEAAVACHSEGINCMTIGLPQVHNTQKLGLVSPLMELARKKGVSGYINGLNNQWAAVHVSDAARLYRLVLEHGKSGEKYLAIGESDIPFSDIARAIGKRLNIPYQAMTQEQAEEHFGEFAYFASLSLNAEQEDLQHELHWRPSGASFLDDLARAEIS